MAFFEIGVVTAVLAAAGLRVIKQQTVGVVETFGKYSRTLNSGIHWVIPGVQQIRGLVKLQVQQLHAEVEVKTLDNMFVKVPVALMVEAIPERAADAFYKLDKPNEQISTWTLNTLRSSAAAMKLGELYEDRSRLAEEVMTALDTRLATYGYRIVSVLIDQPAVSAEVQASFNRVVASEREKEAATQEAEAVRIRMVGEARAEAESQELRAQGIAAARKVLAQSLTDALAQAKANQIPEADIMHLLLETNRLETIRHASEHGKLVLLDVRSGSATPSINMDPLRV